MGRKHTHTHKVVTCQYLYLRHIFCVHRPFTHQFYQRQLRVGVARTETAYELFVTHMSSQSATLTLDGITCVRHHRVGTFQRHEFRFTLSLTRRVEICARNVLDSSLVMCVQLLYPRNLLRGLACLHHEARNKRDNNHV